MTTTSSRRRSFAVGNFDHVLRYTERNATQIVRNCIRPIYYATNNASFTGIPECPFHKFHVI